jgi:hypothetical protein
MRGNVGVEWSTLQQNNVAISIMQPLQQSDSDVIGSGDLFVGWHANPSPEFNYISGL